LDGWRPSGGRFKRETDWEARGSTGEAIRKAQWPTQLIPGLRPSLHSTSTIE
jgi:hypothetical protein